MVECLTVDRRAPGLSLTGVTALCPLARHINPSLVLVQPRKTRPYIAERLLVGCKESKQTNKQNHIKRYRLNKSYLTILSVIHFSGETVERNLEKYLRQAEGLLRAGNVDAVEQYIELCLMVIQCLEVSYPLKPLMGQSQQKSSAFLVC